MLELEEPTVTAKVCNFLLYVPLSLHTLHNFSISHRCSSHLSSLFFYLHLMYRNEIFSYFHCLRLFYCHALISPSFISPCLCLDSLSLSLSPALSFLFSSYLCHDLFSLFLSLPLFLFLSVCVSRWSISSYRTVFAKSFSPSLLSSALANLDLVHLMRSQMHSNYLTGAFVLHFWLILPLIPSFLTYITTYSFIFDLYYHLTISSLLLQGMLKNTTII